MDGLLQIETAEAPQVQSTDQDPMETRWGFNGAVRDKYIEGAKAGFGELPFAKWFKIAHFTTPEEIHSTDDDPNFAREKMVTKTALSAERYLDAMLGGKTLFGQQDPQKTDWGIRFAFHGEEDLAKMEVISATLLPSLPQIRQIAENYGIPSPIGGRCDGEDPSDFGERQSCPTCWRNWIESAACSKFMLEVATNGRQVEVTDIISRTSYKKTIQPTMAELETSRDLMLESLQRGNLANQAIWTTIANELDSKERRGIDAYQNNIRKDVHAAKPQDAQLRNIQEYARAVSSNERAMPVDSNFSDEELAEIYAKRVAAKNAVQASDSWEGHRVVIGTEAAVITEAKSAGWFAAEFISGDVKGQTKNVRKDDFRNWNSAIDDLTEDFQYQSKGGQ